MKESMKKKELGKWIILTILIQATNALTATEISEKCHCDLKQSFCDFGCCCDLDCGSIISFQCFNTKSSFYCPKTQFFKAIKPGVNSSNICYYYNASTTLIDQKILSNSQKTQFLSANKQSSPVSNTINAGYKGYNLQSVLKIGGKSSFSFVDVSGNCLLLSGTSGLSFKFGQNLKVSCVCNNCGTPLLFSQVMGKTIPKYFNVDFNDLTIPSVNDSKITTLRINLIVGKYGSQKIKYIDKATVQYEANGSNIRSLYINFIDGDTIKTQQDSASFFPQIPLDMFYPIHIMS